MIVVEIIIGWVILGLIVGIVFGKVIKNRDRQSPSKRIDYLALVADVKRGLPEAHGGLMWQVSVDTVLYRFDKVNATSAGRCGVCVNHKQDHLHKLPGIKVELIDMISGEIVNDFTKHCHKWRQEGLVFSLVPYDSDELWEKIVDQGSLMPELYKDMI